MAKTYPIPSSARFQDLTGHTFGAWTVVGYAGKSQALTAWLCECTCGTLRRITAGSLRAGRTQSCGCQRRRTNPIRGVDGMPEYMAWQNMKGRCLNPRNGSYQNYGERGITICDEWLHSFRTFLDDMGHRPSPLHTLERIDNDDGYNKSNCKWGTRGEQMRNNRRTRLITFNGTTLCATDWAAATGMEEGTLRRRLNLGWSIERALTTPVAARLSHPK